jgi:putative membrane protein
MDLRVKHRVPEVAEILAVVSLALVFGAVLGVIPRTLLPEAPSWVLLAIPHVNAVISGVAILTIGSGWYWIRNGEIEQHRAAMLTGVGLFAAFLTLYLYKVALQGPTPFAGPAVVRQFVYLPLLVVHISLAIVCVPLLYYVLLLAVPRPIREIPLTRHPMIGRVAASLWLVSFALGIVVYLLLYVTY